MGSRRGLPLVVAAAVVLLLVLVPAPLVLSVPATAMAKPRPRPNNNKLSYYSSAATKAMKSVLRGAWKQLRKEIKDNLMSPSGSGEGQKGDEVKAADTGTAALFIFNLSAGTGASSPQNIFGILDITTPLVWSQCAPCSDCLPPPAPTFQPDQSPTFAKLTCGSDTCQSMLAQTCAANATEAEDYCGYTGVYGTDTNTTGYLANDTFTFGDIPVPNLVFGCSVASVGDFAGASGVFGFSRGHLSLVSQLQLSWFSYFLASDDDNSQSGISSFFNFGGDDVNPTTTAMTNSRSAATPLLSSPLYPEFYYVNLTGIRVAGKDLVDIPAGTFDLRANGSGGVFLSTTMPVTFLEETAYDMVKQAFVKHFNDTAGEQPVDGSAIGLDLCYKSQSVVAVVPEMALVFDGGATMELKKYDYFFADDATSNGGTGLACLTLLPSPQDVSLLGSLLQTGRTMTYDIGKAKPQLIFETPAPAAAAAPAAQSLASLMMALPLAAWVLLF